MKIGNIYIYEQAVKGWDYPTFEKYIKEAGLDKKTGLSVQALAKKLNIEVPKKKEREGGE